MRYWSILALLLSAGCAAPPPARVVVAPPPALPAYAPPVAQPAIGIYEEPPIMQPVPVAIRWAPPPMLVEAPPPPPYFDAVWVGGYWTWDGAWVWAHGHWALPPRQGYYWVHPYYENRNGTVIFITGYWSPPNVAFIPPAPGLHISLAAVAGGAVAGSAPIGPAGVFVPAPPGSRHGIIIPAPVGTAPAVVTSAPPVINVGMRIQHAVNSNNTTIINNVTNVRNVTNVTIVAPASATATGQAVTALVPAQAHVAAALRPVVNMAAPKPSLAPAAAANAAFHSGRAPITAPQAMHPAVIPVGPHEHAAESATAAPHHSAANVAPPAQPTLTPASAGAVTQSAVAPAHAVSAEHSMQSSRQPDNRKRAAAQESMVGTLRAQASVVPSTTPEQRTAPSMEMRAKSQMASKVLAGKRNITEKNAQARDAAPSKSPSAKAKPQTPRRENAGEHG